MGIVSPVRHLEFAASIAALVCTLASGCEQEAAPSPSVEPGTWQTVDSLAALQTLAAQAREERKGLVLDVRADWCAPCKELEAVTFADPGVRGRLAEGYVLAKLDVTSVEPGSPAASLQERVGASTLPRVMVWSMTEADAGAFAKAAVPDAATTLSTFVTAEEFSGALPR